MPEVFEHLVGEEEILVELHQFGRQGHARFPQGHAMTVDRIANATHVGLAVYVQRPLAYVEWRPAGVYLLNIGDAIFGPTREVQLHGLDDCASSVRTRHG